MERNPSRASESPLAQTHEPVAIVGIGCRFPGIDGVEAFWRTLRDGVETIADYPGGRFPYIDKAYESDGVATRRGGFLQGIDRFDASFFGISAREAELLDPQQRLLLETAWEAVDDAGIPAERLAGSRTGVFVGMWLNDYEACAFEALPELSLHATTGTGRYPASGRLSYFFDLRGPSITLDSACSSSLAAIHIACRSLRSGESEMALAGGANVILRPEITLTYSVSGMLAPDGRCKFGDAAANGYVRGEGAGMLLLKPLSRAQADGDPIYAVILGSAVNNDGRSSGQLVAPGHDGQEAVIRAAIEDAGLRPADIDYIEAHGTGTSAGDPVEIETIGRVMAGSGRRRPCAVGSVKTNIGHTESAAGVAGVIKAALAVQRGVIPASLHFEKPNPRVPWRSIPVAVQTRTEAWPEGSPWRRAGVTALGITGTNAHAVLQNAQPADGQARAGGAANRLFLLSARNPDSLRDAARAWRDRLRDNPAWAASLSDLAYTAARRRTHHDFRLAITASGREDLAKALGAWLEGEQLPGAQSGRRVSNLRGRVAFVFPGQGGQWKGMGRGLYSAEPAFRRRLDECDAAIRRYAGWSVVEKLTSGAEIEAIDVVQPCLFAVMAALAELWRSRGIEPGAVVGHSMGEIAAAAVSGALTLDDAAAAICARSSLMKTASGLGAMAVAELAMEDALDFAASFDGAISVAASNSPTSTVLSGDAPAIDAALAALEAREVFCRKVKVEVASHCAHMDACRPELVRSLDGIRPVRSAVPFYSTVTGRVEEGESLDARYWGRNLREPVLFATAMQRLLDDGFDAFIEVNAHPVLSQAIESCIRRSGKDAVAVPTLRRDREETAEFLNAIGALHAGGLTVDFGRLYPEGECLRLPAYPWRRERYWIEAGSGSAARRLPGETAPVEDCAGHVYELRWEGAPQPAGGAKSGLWFVLGAGKTADAISSGLRARGADSVSVKDSAELGRTLEAGGGSCSGVIRVPASVSADAADALREAVDIVSTLRILAAAGVPRLWLATTSLWRLPGDAGDIPASQAPAWGLARVIAREHPEIAAVNVDFPASPEDRDIETLVAAMRSDSPEEQIAIRGGRIWAARHARAELTAETERFRADRAYLIAGGLGGVGLEIAKWLAGRGARYIALAGRRPPSDAARKAIAEIEALGAAARVFSADMADEAQAAATLRATGAEMAPLAGIFHLAGVAESAMLAEMDGALLERVMRSKAAVAWNLHRLAAGLDLDFFVLFSSFSAAIGQAGLGAYSSANAYVDALARLMRAQGRRAVAIQSSAWSGTGMVNDPAVRRGFHQYQKQGILAASPKAALDVLGRMIRSGAEGLLALPADWARMARGFENGELPRAFANLIPRAEAGATPLAASLRDGLLALEDGKDRIAFLENHLCGKLAGVLKTAAARIDPAAPFRAMGVDSLMALEFVRQLSGGTNLRLPATAVFNYPSVHSLAREIARRMDIPVDGAAPAPAKAARAAGAERVEELTDEQAIAALTGGGNGER
jgi:acyl transferase domain-containing protein/acyl carrier protein